jgi:hypothetical protein
LFILYLIKTLPGAYWLGLGWASIEIVYSLIEEVALADIRIRTDKKAIQSKAFLKKSGMQNILKPENTFWGVVERIFATAGHIAFSLLLFWNPGVYILTMPTHSLVNKISLKITKKSIPLTEAFVGAVFLFLFIVSLHLNKII